MVWNKSFLKTLEHHIDSNNTGRLILISFLSTLFPGIEKNSKFKVGLSPSKTVDLICLNESLLQALCVLKIFTFLSWLFWSCRKTVWKELQGKFQNDFTNCNTNNYNEHVAKYLKKWRQSDNEIWSVNRVYREKYFSSKIMQTMR